MNSHMSHMFWYQKTKLGRQTERLTLVSQEQILIDKLSLQEIPKTLCAHGKHDVGLIKNAKPVVTKIWLQTMLNTYWNLKPGITLVFNSLLNAGVIVPRENSPMRTPILSGQKD